MSNTRSNNPKAKINAIPTCDYHQPWDDGIPYMQGSRLLNALGAAQYSYSQDSIVFNQKCKGLKPILPPQEYPELARFTDIREETLTASDGVHLAIWERAAKPGQPHYLFFQGNNGHWGDAWPGDEKDPKYDRGMRIKFLEQIAETGAGFTCINLRGFGKSEGTPSEEGFKKDITAIIDHVKRQKIPSDRLVVSAASLGTWAAAQTACEMTERGMPPALLELLNPYTSIARVGSEIVRKKTDERIAYSPQFIDEHILHNHFNTLSLIQKLAKLQPHSILQKLTHKTQATRLSIITSGRDRLIDPRQGEVLAKEACDGGMKVHYICVPDADHHTIPFATLVQDMVQCYTHRHDQDENFWQHRHTEKKRRLSFFRNGDTPCSSL